LITTKINREREITPVEIVLPYGPAVNLNIIEDTHLGQIPGFTGMLSYASFFSELKDEFATEYKPASSSERCMVVPHGEIMLNSRLSRLNTSCDLNTMSDRLYHPPIADFNDFNDYVWIV